MTLEELLNRDTARSHLTRTERKAIRDAAHRIEAQSITIQSLRQTIGRHEQLGIEAMEVITELLALVEDFMPNIGRCALQDYKRLNDAPIAARAVLDKLNAT